MRRPFLPALLILPTCLALVQCEAPQSVRTDVKPPPYSFNLAYTTFHIHSPLSPAELTILLEQLFKQHPVLRDALPCSRQGIHNDRVVCVNIIGKDAFSAWFGPESGTIALGLVPNTYDLSYKPDYGRFDRLKKEIAEMLIGHFGQANIAIK